MNNIINIFITILNLKKNIFKIGFTQILLVIIGIICTFIIRLNIAFSLLNNLHLIDKLFILFISCCYSSYLLLNLIYNIKQSILFFKYYNSLSSENKNKTIFFLVIIFYYFIASLLQL